MDFTKTGKFATHEEMEKINIGLERAPINPGLFCGSAKLLKFEKEYAKWVRDVQKLCHGIALKHGLPDLDGRYYGISGSEFISP